jgi:adenylate cyclase
VDAERLERWLDRTELPMLVLATAGVAGYLLDLDGVWRANGLEGAWGVASAVIDLAFVVDLLAKGVLLRARYFASPWFLVDLVCTLPILATLGSAPSVLAGLRFVRAFRVLRALRTLRGLRSLRILRFLSRDAETLEQRRFDIVLSVAVTLYSALFVALVGWSRGNLSPAEAAALDGAVGDPDTAELYLVLGSLLGMLLVLVVARFQIPALWAGQMRALLNVALPQQVADYLMKHPEAYDQTVRAPATVIFADIKGFTQTVEALSLDEVKTHLERALDAVVDAHVAQDLIIDKFIGDAVMSFRGGNLVTGTPEEHAVRVVRGALEGAAALRALDDAWFRDVKVGGASATDALIGTFGTSKRLSYTIMGDRVNLAARLEGSCNAVGVRNLFCDRTRALCAAASDIVWRRVGTMRVQGREEAMIVWEAFRGVEPTGWIEPFHRALERYEARDFAAALGQFEAVDGGAPEGDGPSRTYAEACRKLLAEGVPSDWTPILVTKK